MKDWVGLWYVIAKEERGTNDMMDFVRVDHRPGVHAPVSIRDLSHSVADGLGALSILLGRDGHKIGELPAGRSARPRTWRERFNVWKHFLRAVAPTRCAWTTWHPERKVTAREIAWQLWSHEATERLEARCRAEGTTTNAVMLSLLSRVVGEHLTQSDATQTWLFPVNMRGAVTLENPTANHSSAVTVETYRHSTPEEVAAGIREPLKRGIHWGTWWILNVGRIVGLAGMRRLARWRANGNFSTGTFSNLGAWNHGDPAVAWIPCPPGTLNYPIGFATVIWHGRLGYSLKIHPSVCTGGFARVRAILDDFHRRLEAYAGAATPRNLPRQTFDGVASTLSA